MKGFSFLFIAGLLLVLTSCSSELPVRNPEAEASVALKKVEQAEKRCQAALDAARKEKAESEELLRQAKALSVENRKACKIACIEEAKKKANACIVRKKKLEAAQSSAQSNTGSPVDPKYSPSDAPQGWIGK